MIKNYFKIAIRNIRRRPGYAAINVGGLAIGLAACVLILLYVYDELSFDRHNEKYDRIYRVVESQLDPEREEVHVAATAGPVGPVLAQDMPEVEQYVRAAGSFTIGRRTVEFGPNRFYESDYLFTEPAFFEMFDFDWIQGDPSTALNQPNAVVLTKEAAIRYFGEENPMGQTMGFEQFGDMLVKGVIENPPHNAHLDFTLLVSFATLENLERWQEWLSTWDSSRILTYVLLHEGADASALQGRLPAFVERYKAEEFGVDRSIYLQSLPSIHFGSNHIEAEIHWREGNRAYIYIFSIIALFLLVIASVNYVNLATAQALQRAREVGIRKAVGAYRKQLIWQFLSESVLTTVMASVLALCCVVFALPFFNELADKQIELNVQTGGIIWGGMLVLLLGVGFMVGGYPAMFLARFQPVSVLKGRLKTRGSAVWVRKSLVVAQFALSIALVIGTAVILRQLSFIQNKPLGYDAEALISIDINSGNARANFESMKQQLGSIASVQAVSVASNIPGDWKNIPQIAVTSPEQEGGALRNMYFIGADTDFLTTFEIDMAEGRYFSEAFGADSATVLLNETAAKALGISEPAGQLVQIPAGSSSGGEAEWLHQAQVIGIVKDFHFKSLHEPIAPLVLGYWSNPIDVIDYFVVRVETADMPATLAQLRRVGESFDPGHPFEYNFLDERLQDFYRFEQSVARLITIAAGLAIFIACLGLLGLAAFSAEQRIKEIGIRKVLGASVPGIVGLLSGDFLKLVVIAFFVGAPLAYYFMNRWLEAFAYRTEVGIGTLVLALAVALSVAFATVLYRSLRAALSDPVDALRYE